MSGFRTNLPLVEILVASIPPVYVRARPTAPFRSTILTLSSLPTFLRSRWSLPPGPASTMVAAANQDCVSALGLSGNAITYQEQDTRASRDRLGLPLRGLANPTLKKEEKLPATGDFSGIVPGSFRAINPEMGTWHRWPLGVMSLSQDATRSSVTRSSVNYVTRRTRIYLFVPFRRPSPLRPAGRRRMIFSLSPGPLTLPARPHRDPATS